MSAKGGEPKEPTRVKLSSLDAYKELTSLGIDVIKFFPLLNTFHGEVSINKTEEGSLLITAFGSHKFPPDGLRFVYRYEPEKKQSHLVFDVNDGREPNSDLNKILVLQKKITIQEAVGQLGRFLGFTPDETLKKFPRLQDFSRDVLLQYMMENFRSTNLMKMNRHLALFMIIF